MAFNDKVLVFCVVNSYIFGKLTICGSTTHKQSYTQNSKIFNKNQKLTEAIMVFNSGREKAVEW